jgi:uncharacterized membrane protein
MENYTVSEGKAAAIISYFWIIGLIIALIMNSSKKNSFTSFHIRQMIGLSAASVLNGWVVYKFLGGTAGLTVGFILFILWGIELIGAIKGEEKLVPFVGEQFQTWFQNI